MNKKAQAQIITTVLIILLVLAAIVIVWQVVSGTIEEGGDEITAQSKCIGLTIDLSQSGVNITVRPSKDVDGFRVYSNGAQIGTGDGSILGAFVTNSVTVAPVTVGTNVITSAGLMGEQWCEGLDELEIIVPAP